MDLIDQTVRGTDDRHEQRVRPLDIQRELKGKSVKLKSSSL